MKVSLVVLGSVLLLAFAVLRADLTEAEVDGSGAAFIEQIITVYNDFNNQSISVFWDGNNADLTNKKVKMNDIPARKNMKINTYIGHVFYATPTHDPEFRLSTPFQMIAGLDVTDFRYGLVVDTPARTLGAYNAFDILTEEDKQISLRHTPRHPQVKLMNVKSTAMSAKFRCLATAVDMWYDDGKDGSPQGFLKMGQESTTNTYEGHVFFFTKSGDKSVELARFIMNKDQVTYVIRDPGVTPPRTISKLLSREESFAEEYLQRTGVLWRHYYGPNGPRPAPILHMWPAEELGQLHVVESDKGYWQCDGPASSCQSTDTITFHLEVVSKAPKVFIIENFISHFEADEIIRIARHNVNDSIVGSREGGGIRKSDTRTSRNAWVAKHSNKVTETLFLRAADLLKIDPIMLERDQNTEDMQVVHYVNEQKYEAHHDWGVSGYPESRFITLLMYLTDMDDDDAGGETSFPKAAGGLGFKVHPGKGNAVLFYNLLEDGNGDDLALHAALPIHRGEKWLANFWVWDPKRK